ncbi:tail fiber protein [Spirosoma daeguense]
MSEPFLAAIIMFAGNFAPRGWAFCQGQILSIAQNTALFSLLGTTYGGNGQTTFALPDLRGRVPVGPGQGPGLPPINLGQMSGEPTHTLIITEMPAHNHAAQAQGNTKPGAASSPGGNTWASSGGLDPEYINEAPNAPMASNTVSVGIAGGSQPHNNMQPYLGLNYIIATEGIYPSRN